MTVEKAGPDAHEHHLTVQVREVDKKELTSKEIHTHTAFLSGQGRVTSTFWAYGEGKVNGRFVFTFNFGSDVTVNAFSQVAASITELNSPDRNPFLGSAAMSILNVVPSSQRVLIRGLIDWGSPLDFRLNLIIAN